MGRRAFVFNGLIKDLSFPRPLEGRIAVYSHSAGGIAYSGIDADNGLGVFFPYR